MTKERRTFSSEFKLQVVRLYENGKLKNEIIREYDLKPSIFSNSIKQHQNTESFNHQDNLKSDEKELIKLRKEVQHLKMEHISALNHLLHRNKIQSHIYDIFIIAVLFD
ncbi:transposase [Staphylococcus aureus]|nr:transposase [Staphylococcus aureus]